MAMSIVYYGEPHFAASYSADFSGNFPNMDMNGYPFSTSKDKAQHQRDYNIQSTIFPDAVIH